jgi:hypothetical protein
MAACRSVPRSWCSSWLKPLMVAMTSQPATGINRCDPLPTERASISLLPALAAWVLLPIRLIVGYGFMAHGYAKLSRGPETFAALLHTLGVPERNIAEVCAK